MFMPDMDKSRIRQVSNACQAICIYWGLNQFRQFFEKIKFIALQMKNYVLHSLILIWLFGHLPTRTRLWFTLLLLLVCVSGSKVGCLFIRQEWIPGMCNLTNPCFTLFDFQTASLLELSHQITSA